MKKTDLSSKPVTIQQNAREFQNWKEFALQCSRNADFYRDLIVRVGQIVGEEVHICDDEFRSELDAIARAGHWKEFAVRCHQNAQLYRDLIVKVGQIIGEEAYICDDGSRSEDVLCLKVPELVDKLLSDARRLTSRQSCPS